MHDQPPKQFNSGVGFAEKLKAGSDFEPSPFKLKEPSGNCQGENHDQIG
jgi:hypothetical protein